MGIMVKAGEIYWDSLSEEESMPKAFDPKAIGLNKYIS